MSPSGQSLGEQKDRKWTAEHIAELEEPALNRRPVPCPTCGFTIQSQLVKEEVDRYLISCPNCDNEAEYVAKSAS
jgi:transcription elongation factor Elf1